MWATLLSIVQSIFQFGSPGTAGAVILGFILLVYLFLEFIFKMFRYFHVRDNKITFGEFDRNCENVVKVKDFLKNL